MSATQRPFEFGGVLLESVDQDTVLIPWICSALVAQLVERLRCKLFGQGSIRAKVNFQVHSERVPTPYTSKFRGTKRS